MLYLHVDLDNVAKTNKNQKKIKQRYGRKSNIKDSVPDYLVQAVLWQEV